MITRRTKIQLIVFVLITLLGVTFVGARYARLDRLVFDTSYTVVAHFADSGGIFAGAEVAYRGVARRPGRRSCELTDDGVDVYLDIDNDLRRRSRPTRWPWSATARRSVSSTSTCSRRPTTGPTSQDGSEIADGRHPDPDPDRRSCSTTSPPPSSRSTSRPCGPPSTSSARRSTAPARTSQRIIDTGNSFIEAANDNFDVTTALIQDSNTVLRRPDRLGRRDPHLRPRPGAVQRHAGRLRPGPAHGDRQRLGDRQPAAHVPRGQQGRPRPS